MFGRARSISAAVKGEFLSSVYISVCPQIDFRRHLKREKFDFSPLQEMQG
jgi:hypothetical protein